MNLLRYFSLFFVATLALPMQSQDLMARQAPIDVKLRAVDSVFIKRLIQEETIEEPALTLYQSWSHDFVNYANLPVPLEYKIDLRQFHMPTDSRIVNSHYGYRKQFHRSHYGTDIKGYMGDTIRAAFSGKVRMVKYEPKGFGKYVVIRHPNGLETIYGHMSKQIVQEDQVVKAGDPIGLVGSTGRSTGPHLHFETRFLGVKIDPETFFDFENGDMRGDFYVYRANGGSQLMDAREAQSLPEVKQELVMAKSEESRAFQEQKKKRTSRQQRIYKVRKGDTLSKIARANGISVTRLCQLNHISSKKALRPGQILKCS